MLPDLSVFWVVFFVLLLTLILDRLFFRPLLAIVKQREDAAGSAKKLAEQATAEARRATEEFERQTAAARRCANCALRAIQWPHNLPESMRAPLSRTGRSLRRRVPSMNDSAPAIR